MTKLFYKGTPTTGTEAMFEFKELLVSAGWTVEGSGDGTTYNPTGDQFATYTAMAVNRAWFRISSPDGRELLIQRGSVDYQYRVLFSRSTGFVTGSPNANTTPDAVDQQIVIGGGTAASPTMANILNSSNGSYRFKACADDAAPYSFWAVGHPTGGGNHNAAWFLDTLTNLITGDADANIILFDDGAMLDRSSIGFSTTGPYGFEASATPANWVRFSAATYTMDNVQVVPSAMPTSPITTEDEPWPMVFGRRTAVSNPGYKGVSSILRWTSVARNDGDTFTENTARDQIVFGDVCLDWDGTVPTV